MPVVVKVKSDCLDKCFPAYSKDEVKALFAQSDFYLDVFWAGKYLVLIAGGEIDPGNSAANNNAGD